MSKDIGSAFSVVSVFLVALGALLGISFGVGILMAMWAAWWMVPVWAKVLVPLGVPPIGFWHLVAFRMVVANLWPPHVANAVKEQYKEEHAWIGNLLVLVIGPVWTYYIVMWAMS